MSTIDNPIPAAKLYLQIAGRRITMAHIDKLGAQELRVVKGVCGMNLRDFQQGIAGLDVDAWTAWIYISLLREDKNATRQLVERMMGDTPLLDLLNALEEETPEVAQPDPPSSPSPTGSSGNGDMSNGASSGVTIPPPSTPATSGLPT